MANFPAGDAAGHGRSRSLSAVETFHWNRFHPFSYPGIAADEDFFAMVAQAYARMAIEEALRFPETAAGGFEAVLESLRSWSRRDIPLPDQWHASIGRLASEALSGRSAQFPDLLARACVDIAGQLDDFHVDFTRFGRAPLIIGRWLLRPGLNVGLQKANGVVTVRLAHGTSHRCLHSGNTRILVQEADFVMVPASGSIRIVAAQTLTTADPCGLPLAWDDVSHQPAEPTVSEGLGLLAEAAPNVFRWVRRLVHTVLVIPRPPAGDCSGSWPNTFGTIYLSRPKSALKAAEVLVHEAAHQYFHMAERIAPIRAAHEEGLYHSPSVNALRSLDRILLAYHAFANVLLFYAACSHIWIADTWAHDRVSYLRDLVDILDSPLQSVDGLTELGQAIYLPLRDKLNGSRFGS